MSEPNPGLVAFGARLKALRRAYGAAIGRPSLSARKFAAELAVRPPTYGRWERGEMAPPFEVLKALRVMTGVSLDRLIADMPPGGDSIEVESRGQITISFGKRLRWAREVMAPNIEDAAEVMGMSSEAWAQFENDEVEPPVVKMREFAHRFSVTLDFLYDGSLKGVPYPVKRELLKKHPELGRIVGIDKGIDAGTLLRSKDSARRPQGLGKNGG